MTGRASSAAVRSSRSPVPMHCSGRSAASGAWPFSARANEALMSRKDGTMIRTHLALLLFAVLGTGTAEARRLPPVDGCVRAPGFAAFRTRLLRAVARQDVAFIRRMITHDIVNSPGSYPG